MKSFRFLDKEKDIINLYLNNVSIIQIALKFKCDRDTISRLLKRSNIKIRSLGSHLRKFNLNHNYFDTIDTEDYIYL